MLVIYTKHKEISFIVLKYNEHCKLFYYLDVSDSKFSQSARYIVVWKLNWGICTIVMVIVVTNPCFVRIRWFFLTLDTIDIYHFNCPKFFNKLIIIYIYIYIYVRICCAISNLKLFSQYNLTRRRFLSTYIYMSTHYIIIRFRSVVRHPIYFFLFLKLVTFPLRSRNSAYDWQYYCKCPIWLLAVYKNRLFMLWSKAGLFDFSSALRCNNHIYYKKDYIYIYSS